MKWVSALLEIAVFIAEWSERRRQKRLDKERHNEVDAIQDNPAEWIATRYGVRKRSTLPGDAAKAGETDVSSDSPGQRRDRDGSE